MVVSLKPEGCVLPLEPAPIVVSTHGHKSFLHPLGLLRVARDAVMIHRIGTIGADLHLEHGRVPLARDSFDRNAD